MRTSAPLKHTVAYILDGLSISDSKLTNMKYKCIFPDDYSGAGKQVSTLNIFRLIKTAILW